MYDEVVALGLPTSSKDEMKEEAGKQGNWFQTCHPYFSVTSSFQSFQLSWQLVSSWGVRGLLTALGMTLPEDVTTYTQILTDTAFIILPGLGCLVNFPCIRW